MRLFLLGVLHDDPLVRRRLIRWYEQTRNEKPSEAPAFVAVEWGMAIYASMLGQRDTFVALAREQWPKADGGLLEELGQTIAFEGDAHAAAYPHASVIWLDNKRVLAESETAAIDTMASCRIRQYSERCERALPMGEAETALGEISEGARRAAQSDPWSDGKRDLAWFQEINSRHGPTDGGWACVVVGRAHVEERLGSLREFLELAGYECQVVDLTNP